MNILKHEGIVKIFASNTSETKREVRESIRQGFRYAFADDLSIGEEVIQFSGRTWGFLIVYISPLKLIDDGKIHIEESKNSISITYSVSYSQYTITWTIVAIGMLITFFILYLLNIVPFFLLLSPIMIFGMLAVLIALTIIRFESLLERCLARVNGNKIRVPF